MNALQLLRKLD